MASLVTVAVYHDLPSAMVARSCLEAYGLVAVLPEWYHSAVAWQLIFALHGLRLWTVDSTAEIAEELLDGAAPEYVAGIKEKQSGWLNADITIVDIVIAAVVIVMISLPLPLWKRRRAKSRGAECAFKTRPLGRVVECPLLGVKRTSIAHVSMSAFDPKRTFSQIFSDVPFCPNVWSDPCSRS